MQINISIVLAPPWFSSCIRHWSTPLGSRGDGGRYGGLGLVGDLVVSEISIVSAAPA
jgi:hypothetical protein